MNTGNTRWETAKSQWILAGQENVAADAMRLEAHEEGTRGLSLAENHRKIEAEIKARHVLQMFREAAALDDNASRLRRLAVRNGVVGGLEQFAAFLGLRR